MALVDHIHPNDVGFFTEVATRIREVARDYNLPLRRVRHMANPNLETSPQGRCHADGTIELTIRVRERGKWSEGTVSPERIWQVAAHELAHLRHFNHGQAFQEFESEMLAALTNRRQDTTAAKRDKVLDRLVKMQALRDSEAQIGNLEAAENFAAAINKMLVENELNPSDIDYARAQQDDPVIEVRVDMAKYGIERKNARIAWQEHLAGIVARGNLCSFLLRKGSNQIWFVGTRSHALVAEYIFGMLVPTASQMASTERTRVWAANGKLRGAANPTLGFRESYLDAFVQRIDERLREMRDAAVQASVSTEAGMSHSQALVRLNQPLMKVQEYLDGKFKRTAVSGISGRANHNSAGRAAGRAAADAIPLGRKGVAAPQRRLS